MTGVGGEGGGAQLPLQGLEQEGVGLVGALPHQALQPFLRGQMELLGPPLPVADRQRGAGLHQPPQPGGFPGLRLLEELEKALPVGVQGPLRPPDAPGPGGRGGGDRLRGGPVLLPQGGRRGERPAAVDGGGGERAPGQGGREGGGPLPLQAVQPLDQPLPQDLRRDGGLSRPRGGGKARQQADLPAGLPVPPLQGGQADPEGLPQGGALHGGGRLPAGRGGVVLVELEGQAQGELGEAGLAHGLGRRPLLGLPEHQPGVGVALAVRHGAVAGQNGPGEAGRSSAQPGLEQGTEDPWRPHGGHTSCSLSPAWEISSFSMMTSLPRPSRFPSSQRVTMPSSKPQERTGFHPSDWR